MTAVFGSVLSVYLHTMHRSLGDGDSGEFAFCSAALAVPHPPGYPLLILLTRGYSWLVAAVVDVGRVWMPIPQEQELAHAFMVQHTTSVLYSATAAMLLCWTCHDALRCN